MYLSGTRADYGLMRHTLRTITNHADLELGVIVTGMHLDKDYGETISEIEADGFSIVKRIPTNSYIVNSHMARGIASVIEGCCDLFAVDRPDLLLVLGDRGEMLGGAIASIYSNIPVAHIHGGERSGTVDEPVRHAISKLAHLHLTATQVSADRLISMGESADRVFCVGAPGLDDIMSQSLCSREMLFSREQLQDDKPVALLLLHPVVQTYDEGSRHIQSIIEAIRAAGYRMVGLRPNSDVGGEAIRRVLDAEAGASDLRLHTHLPRHEFLSWMAAADVMIGNSSSGIIEAASFGTPVINVGNRQRLRERNLNVFDVDADTEQLIAALKQARSVGKFPATNVYGDGKSAERITHLLASLPLDRSLLEKICAY